MPLFSLLMATAYAAALSLPRAPAPTVVRAAVAPAVSPRSMTLASMTAVESTFELASDEYTFNDTWYAVAFAGDLSSEQPFAMRLWGEPVVLYRDAAGEAVCVRDVCPHRSAPLSMGEIQDGVLRCFYHGWGFGAKGECVSIPTGSAPQAAFCATSYAVVEQDGMLWVWRGETLAADARKLPSIAAAPAGSVTVDTTLDYGLEWSRLVTRSLEGPHLSQAQGEAPSGEDGASSVELGAPVTVRHSGVGGGVLGTFSEEAVVVPIGLDRSRVLLRQRFEPPAPLAALLQLPGALAVFQYVVQNLNYEKAIDEESGAAARRPAAGSADRIAAFRSWSERAQSADGTAAPYFAAWAKPRNWQPDGPQQVDEAFGTYGLRKSYVLETPLASFAPLKERPDDLRGGLVFRLRAQRDAVVAAALSAPAGLLTYKTIAPAVAASLFGAGGAH